LNDPIPTVFQCTGARAAVAIVGIFVVTFLSVHFLNETIATGLNKACSVAPISPDSVSIIALFTGRRI
jgi:hypothetical protein